jgi:hypothetical protein
MKYRHELKYIINNKNYVLIKSRLSNLLQSDAHVDSDGSYTVRSLYFDDYFNSAYHEKYAGAFSRVKYRIRVYNSSDHFIRLERKLKSDRYVLKQQSALTRSDVNNILDGDYGFLYNSSDTLQQVFYHECVSNLMRPRVVVEYDREPYVMEAGNVRINFDKNIRAGVEGFDIFNKEMSMIETMEAGLMVMEVKYSELLPNIVRKVLPSEATDYVSVSKYIFCCDKVMHKQRSSF